MALAPAPRWRALVRDAALCAQWVISVLLMAVRVCVRSLPRQHVQSRGGRHVLHALPVWEHQPVWLDRMHVQPRLLDVGIRCFAGLHRFVVMF